jgi:hypothetical protein
VLIRVGLLIFSLLLGFGFSIQAQESSSPQLGSFYMLKGDLSLPGRSGKLVAGTVVELISGSSGASRFKIYQYQSGTRTRVEIADEPLSETARKMIEEQTKLTVNSDLSFFNSRRNRNETIVIDEDRRRSTKPNCQPDEISVLGEAENLLNQKAPPALPPSAPSTASPLSLQARHPKWREELAWYEANWNFENYQKMIREFNPPSLSWEEVVDREESGLDANRQKLLAEMPSKRAQALRAKGSNPQHKKSLEVTWHHSATVDNPLKTWTVQDLQRIHMLEREWDDIGYNWAIDSEGNIFEGRRGQGAHVKGSNQHREGVVVFGNFDPFDAENNPTGIKVKPAQQGSVPTEILPTPKQVAAMLRLQKSFMDPESGFFQHRLALGLQARPDYELNIGSIIGHSEACNHDTGVKAPHTACPGKGMEYVVQGFRNRFLNQGEQPRGGMLRQILLRQKQAAERKRAEGGDE